MQEEGNSPHLNIFRTREGAIPGKKYDRLLFFYSAVKRFVLSSELGAVVQNCLLGDFFICKAITPLQFNRKK